MIFNLFVAYLLLVTLVSLKSAISDKLFYFNSLLIILFVGLRGYDVGSVDTLNYVNFFVGKQSYYNTDTRDIESGFVIYNDVLKVFISTGWQYLLFNAAFSLVPLFYLIKKYSSNIHFSLLLFFVGLGLLYTVYFVCTRQVIATAFVLWGIIIFLNKTRFYPYFFVILSILGAMIHSSVPMISIAFIVLLRVKIPRNVYVSICVGTFVLGYVGFFENFDVLKGIFLYLNFVFSRLSSYADISFADKSFFLYPFTRSLIGVIICFVARDKLYNDVFTKLFLVSIIIGNLFPSFQEIYRLVGLFSIFGLVSSTYIYDAMFVLKFNRLKTYMITKKLVKPFVTMSLAFIVFYSYYKFADYLILLETKKGIIDNATLVPYKFFWEDKYNF